MGSTPWTRTSEPTGCDVGTSLACIHCFLRLCSLRKIFMGGNDRETGGPSAAIAYLFAAHNQKRICPGPPKGSSATTLNVAKDPNSVERHVYYPIAIHLTSWTGVASTSSELLRLLLNSDSTNAFFTVFNFRSSTRPLVSDELKNHLDQCTNTLLRVPAAVVCQARSILMFFELHSSSCQDRFDT